MVFNHKSLKNLKAQRNFQIKEDSIVAILLFVGIQLQIV
jgi:hypothetical protein